MTTTSQADINSTNTNGTNGPASSVVGGMANDNGGVGGGAGIGIPNKTVSQQQQQHLMTTTTTTSAATTNGATSSQRGGSGNVNGGGSETNVKRKKYKSRNASANLTSSVGGGSGSSGYTKDHLDAWLENCLRDAANTQLSSSSEFLDFNPAMTTNRANFMQSMQQQQQHMMSSTPQQNHQPQQQQQMSNLHNFNTPQQQPQQQQPTQSSTSAATAAQQYQQQQQHQTTSQQQFLLRSNSQPYSVGMGGGGAGGNGSYSAPFSLGIQRNTPSYMRSTNSLSSRYPLMFPASTNGVGGSGSGLFYGQNDASQDFASLPPIVNLLGGLGNSENEHNSTDVLDGSNSQPNINRGFRFSDPCLLNPSDNDSKLSGQNTPDRRTAMPPSDMENNKFFAALMEQINILHETNSKICRNLHETKVDIEALKHTPTSWGGGGIGMRHRRDSLSGLSTQSQPLAFGGGFGTQSPAPTFHSAYAPGMMTDVVREVKEAARVREDALLNRVKSMVEERQWSMNEGNVRILRDIDELKTYVLHLRLERKEINKRLNHLEAENRYMRQLLASLYNNRNAPDIIYENEALRTRKSSSYANSRRTQSFNLNYGTIHQQPLASVGVGGAGSGPGAAVNDEEQQKQPLDESIDVLSNVSAQRTSDLRNSFSSTDSCIGSSSQAALSNKPTAAESLTPQTQSPPNFTLISKQENQQLQQQQQQHEQQQQHKKLLPRNKNASNEQEKDATSDKEQLKRELHEAVAARNEADQRIIALEKLVSSLALGAGGQTIDPTMIQPSNNNYNNNITNGIGGGLVRNFNDSTTTTSTVAAATSAASMWPIYSQHHHHQQQLQQQQQYSHSINSTAVHTNPLTPYTSNTSSSSRVNANNSGAGNAPKLSVAGPITDL